ncbi:MAG: hypothetical protein KDI19_12280, partial [Pseudomonadales bacterium]|nr:hypothetical protein [Pseudomonadales bacterium]
MVPAGEGSVQLEDGQSASTLLHDVLARTVEAFPETFGSLSIPERDAFRKAYCDWLPQFESARLSSQARVQVARFAVGQAA